jgi:hypothetical protein
MPVTKSELRSLVTAEGAMILDIEADEITTINSTAGYIWERLRNGDQVSEIVADLARDTGQDVSTIAGDVNEFLEQLAEKRLVSL